MSDSTQEVAADSAVANNEDQVVTKEEQAEEVVPKARLDKVVDEMMAYKKRYADADAALKTREMEDLKKREEWQTVAKIKEEEAQKAKDEAMKLRESIVFEKKYSALKEEAMKMGIRKEALSDLELIDFDDVGIETTSTGRVNVLNADVAVQKLKTLRPHWFGAKTGNINSSEPEVVQSSGVTYNDLLTAEKKAKESGDYAPYEKLLRKYKTQ